MHEKEHERVRQKPLWTISETARMYGITYQAVSKAIKKGKVETKGGLVVADSARFYYEWTLGRRPVISFEIGSCALASYYHWLEWQRTVERLQKDGQELLKKYPWLGKNRQ